MTSTPGSARRVATLVLVLVAIAGCGGGTVPASLPPATNATEVPGLPTTVDGLPTLEPAAFDALLASLRGTPVVVNFWASWCDPCVREAPVLHAAHARVGDRVQFLGVDMQDARDGALRFLETHDVRFPSVFDPSNAIGTRRGLFAPPMTIVYDADGEVAATLPGELSSRALDEALALVTG